MQERIDIVDLKTNPTGKSASKTKIHTKGYLHNTAHIWFYTNTGEILLAQRAATKTICPLLWDVSVAGHVDAGETIEQAAIRETKEEIGLTITEENLEKIGVFPSFQTYKNGIIDNEFHHTYIAKLTVAIATLNFQKKEVENLKLVSISEFKKLLNKSQTNNHFVSTNKKVYQLILQAILEKTTPSIKNN